MNIQTQPSNTPPLTVVTIPEVKSFLQRDHRGNIGGQLHFINTGFLQEMLSYAINAYGFLIGRNEKVLPAQFIERIRDAYDCDTEPRNKAVVQALAQLL
ncbi:hypothetical protein os4_37080 (plasmid) [Comamonadaceae bacterium OS-4]|nr:hypothetical protein os4_37080 [Comamonadaceae bacterium OS-4]